MYICSNCGTAFDGRVCPGCCAMRPAAAVLGSSGRILRSRETSSVPPEEQAERFAEELEYSRQADEWRRQRQERAEKMRRRAAQLAQAAQRQQELTDEEKRYARQAEKAANWKRKAPGIRADQPDEVEVEMPDALRSLKIDSRNPDKPAASVQKNTPGSRSSRDPADPSSSRSEERRQNDADTTICGKASLRSERLDAAWRSFASGQPASGKNVVPRLPDERALGKAAALPRPPLSRSSDDS